jgi:hypothetical protein
MPRAKNCNSIGEDRIKLDSTIWEKTKKHYKSSSGITYPIYRVLTIEIKKV